jgi:hypothetical protein
MQYLFVSLLFKYNFVQPPFMSFFFYFSSKKTCSLSDGDMGSSLCPHFSILPEICPVICPMDNRDICFGDGSVYLGTFHCIAGASSVSVHWTPAINIKHGAKPSGVVSRCIRPPHAIMAWCWHHPYLFFYCVLYGYLFNYRLLINDTRYQH